MNGIQYEKACARYLKQHGYHNIEMTPPTGDQGIDLICYRRHKKYGFQCKYYSRSVGNKAVQQAYAGMKYYECDYAGVITNNVFTDAAIRLADATDVILLEEITPSMIYLPSFLLFFSCFMLLCFGIGEAMTFASSGSDFANLHMFHAITLMASAVFAAGSTRRRNIALIAVIFFLLNLLSASVLLTGNPGSSFLLETVFTFLVAVYTAINLLSLIRTHSENQTAILRKELKDEMEETLTRTGVHFGSLLERDLHAAMRLEKAERPSSEVCRFTYYTDHDVSDVLPSIEALMNHTSAADHIDDQYVLIAVDEHTMIAEIHTPNA